MVNSNPPRTIEPDWHLTTAKTAPNWPKNFFDGEKKSDKNFSFLIPPRRIARGSDKKWDMPLSWFGEDFSRFSWH